MPKHMWVEMQITSVDIEVNPENPEKLDIFTTDTQQEAAKEDAQVACWVCGHNPSSDNLNEECPGEKTMPMETPQIGENES